MILALFAALPAKAETVITTPTQRLATAACELRLDTHKPRIALVSVVSPNYDVPTFNLGLAELGGYLKHRHQELQHGISYIEPDIELAQSPELKNSVEFTLKKLRELKPAVIGFSVKIGSTQNLFKLLDGLREEEWARHAVLLVGNVVATFSHHELAARFPEVIYVLGDGELSIDQIYEILKTNSGDLKTTPNLMYVDDDNQNVTTLKRTLNYAEQCWLPDLDTLLPLSLQNHADITIRATTGCSSHCTFCSIRSLGLFTKADGRVGHMGWQSFPPERTVEILQHLQAKGIERVNLADDELGNVDWTFLDALAEQLIAAGNRVRFNASMRLDAIWRVPRTKEDPVAFQADMDRRMHILKRLRQAGLDSLFVGAESGSASQIQRYGKGYPVRVNVEALKTLTQLGFNLSVGFIPFDPLVERAEIEENLKFLETSIGEDLTIGDLVASPLNVMRVQRGTPYEKLMDKKGLLGPLEDNLTFYASQFADPQMEFLAMTGQTWFRDILADRYPVIQLSRMAYGNPAFPADTFKRSRALLREVHRLDIAMVRTVLRDLVPQAAIDAAKVTEDLQPLRQKRDAIARQMRELIEEVYNPRLE